MPPGDLIPSRGAVATAMVMTVVRELTAEDVMGLMLGGRNRDVVGPPPLQKLKARHHQQARLVAQGRKNIEVAALTGTTPQRISDLQKDPTFMELVGFYADQMMVSELEDAQRIQRKYVLLGEDALDEIQDRLDDPQRRASISTDTLIKLSAEAADRTVAPRKVAQSMVTPPANITFNIAGRGLEPPPPVRPILADSSTNPPLTIEHQIESDLDVENFDRIYGRDPHTGESSEDESGSSTDLIPAPKPKSEPIK